MLGSHIRWSDDTIEEADRRKEIESWYHLALKAIEERQITFLGRRVNLRNPKEIIALLYVLQKEYESFHEPF